LAGEKEKDFIDGPKENKGAVSPWRGGKEKETSLLVSLTAENISAEEKTVEPETRGGGVTYAHSGKKGQRIRGRSVDDGYRGRKS